MKYHAIVVLSIAVLTLFVGCSSHDGTSGASGRKAKANDSDNPMGLNGGCYVCHMTFVDEKLTTRHLKQEIGCTHCHGTSAGHANDENIGATPPDVTFERTAIDAFCQNCHKKHDITSGKMKKHLQKRRKDQPDMEGPPACTDCHGKHRIGEF